MYKTVHCFLNVAQYLHFKRSLVSLFVIIFKLTIFKSVVIEMFCYINCLKDCELAHVVMNNKYLHLVTGKTSEAFARCREFDSRVGQKIVLFFVSNINEYVDTWMCAAEAKQLLVLNNRRRAPYII